MSQILSGRAGVVAGLLCAVLVTGACDAAPAPNPPASPSGAPVPAGPPVAAESPEQVVGNAAVATTRAGSARTVLLAETAVGTVRATGPVRFAPFAADLTATVGTREVALRAVDGTSWARFGTRWQQLSPGLLPVGAVSGALRSATGLSGVSEVGPEQVGDVATTRYRGTVDLAAVPAPEPTAKAELGELAALASPTPEIDVWVGPDGRIVQLRTGSVATPGTRAADAPTPGAITVTLSDLGVPVEVTPPPTG
ncbi:hypothetical protein [Pseudonocardia sp. KRD291]|uniref:hypothetical protein n=1 Tax=Pseudonocardia sp. KRD291 TaxID=2792007 RepID=UPI001C49D062|nr:hypothetical protein [Pseudonocardia sp. KRD291]MBW0101982.1 hypothetical protein [Pseudonocardia sp. KRD291]